jgi:hypothetical protein
MLSLTGVTGFARLRANCAGEGANRAVVALHLAKVALEPENSASWKEVLDWQRSPSGKAESARHLANRVSEAA